MKTFAFAHGLIASAIIAATGPIALAQPGAVEAPAPPAPTAPATTAPAPAPEPDAPESAALAAHTPTPAPGSTKPTAPVNAARTQVKDTDGQPVPVGQKNDRPSKVRRTNISANLFVSYGISVSYALNGSEHLALTVATGTGISKSRSSTVLQLSASVPIYFGNTYHGLFVEPGFLLQRSSTDTVCRCTETKFGPELLVGWQAWDSGFNLSLAFGLGYDFSGTTKRAPTEINFGFLDDSEVLPSGYLRLGYAF
jgi:hypothetical protein